MACIFPQRAEEYHYKKLWSSGGDTGPNWKEAAVNLPNGTFYLFWTGKYGTNNNTVSSGSSTSGQTHFALADISCNDAPCPTSTQGNYNSK